MDRRTLVTNIVAVARTAKLYGLPIVLSTVNVKTGLNQPTIHQVQDMLSGVESFDRTTINAWEDAEFVKAVKASGRKKLIMTALWTEACLTFPALDALREGYEVFPVVDAIGGTSPEAHRAALERITQAGAKPIGWVQLMCEPNLLTILISRCLEHQRKDHFEISAVRICLGLRPTTRCGVSRGNPRASPANDRELFCTAADGFDGRSLRRIHQAPNVRYAGRTGKRCGEGVFSQVAPVRAKCGVPICLPPALPLSTGFPPSAARGRTRRAHRCRYVHGPDGLPCATVATPKAR